MKHCDNAMNGLCHMPGRTALWLLLIGVPGLAIGEGWTPLAKDGLHDPNGPAITQLQEPGEGLAGLPADKAGNKVRWVEALRSGAIAPRRYRTDPSVEIQVLDMDIMLDLKGSMPIVRFPHLAHTQWLDCSNCHPVIFVPKKGANPISMFNILNGEQCGICHGAVAFPLTECERCHSVKR